MMLKLKLQYFGHLMRRVDLLEKTLMLGRDWGQEEKGTTEDEMAGRHHGLDGREFEWTLGVGDGQGGLACCDPWGHKESDTTEQLNWTELFGFLHDLRKSLWGQSGLSPFSRLWVDLKTVGTGSIYPPIKTEDLCHDLYIRNIHKLPWWLSAKESACQCRRHRFNPWSQQTPHAMEQLSPCVTATEAWAS